MTRVKTNTVPAGIHEAIFATMARARAVKSPPIPEIPNLDHWFRKDIQEALASLSVTIRAASETHQDILRLALSSIIVRVSNQDSDTRYAAVPKKGTHHDVFLSFERAAYNIVQSLCQRGYNLTSATVIEADTLRLKPQDIRPRPSVVITSPPYPNAYEYWLYHKYRMWWLGLDPLAVKEKEIGARAHFFSTNPHTANHFVGQMRQTFALLKNVMIPGGYACFVIGRSKIHGAIIDNAQIIVDASALFGFAPVFRTERTILAHRKSFNLSHANIKTETVLIFRN